MCFKLLVVFHLFFSPSHTLSFSLSFYSLLCFLTIEQSTDAPPLHSIRRSGLLSGLGARVRLSRSRRWVGLTQLSIAVMTYVMMRLYTYMYSIS